MAEHDDNPLQGYYEWQVTTLLLAYDLAQPLAQGDDAGSGERRHAVEDEVRALSLAQVPEVYKANPDLDWPPEVMMALTRATLFRAAQITGLVEPQA